MTSDQEKSIYFLPLEDKFIIYLPYKPLAFIGNTAMVDYIQSGAQSDDAETRQLLQNIGFYAPDQRRLIKERAEAAFKPTIGVLLLTTACNMNCVYCYASAGSGAGQTMPFSVGQAVIDQVCRNARELKKSFSLCLHGGGEPTVVKKLLMD
ncbi:MAG: radical SAM protein, partial [Calditrichaeota bacterium]